MGISPEELKQKMAALSQRVPVTLGDSGLTTYYNPTTAAQFGRVLQKWADNNFRPYLIDIKRLGWTQPKLRAYVFNARRYIITQQADEFPALAKIAERCRLKITEHGALMIDRGVLSHDTETTVTDLVDAVVEQEKYPRGRLRHEILIFISSEQKHRSMFERPSKEDPVPLHLSSTDVKWIKDRLDEVRGFYIGTVTNKHVRIIKYTQEDEDKRLAALAAQTAAPADPPNTPLDAPVETSQRDVTECTDDQDDFFS